jgi:hypothetical protein
MLRWLRDLLTGPDGETYDLQLVLTFVGVLLFFANSIGALWLKGQTWSPTDYATGLGVVLAAGALGGRLNKWTHNG